MARHQESCVCVCVCVDWEQSCVFVCVCVDWEQFVNCSQHFFFFLCYIPGSPTACVCISRIGVVNESKRRVSSLFFLFSAPHIL